MKCLSFLLLAICILAAYAKPKTQSGLFLLASSAESNASNESNGTTISSGAEICANAYNQAQEYNNQQIATEISGCLQSPISMEQDLGTQKSCISHVLGHAKTNLGNAVDTYKKCLENYLNNSMEQ